MAVDVLILNTAAIDLRHKEFQFVDDLVGQGGLAKCEIQDMPGYSQRQIFEWIQDGHAAAGGSGNIAPLIAKSDMRVAIGANLGCGDYDGLDAQGRFFYDSMVTNGVDMSQIFIHPDLPTGTSFIHDAPGDDRGGIGYFPNANNDFDF
jgi:sugar/nucleoside kinase (ribokinase family)